MNPRVFGRRWLLLSVFLMGLLPTPSAPARLVINEIMYHPPTDVEAQEWIELYNAGPAVETLTGWELRGAVTYWFPTGKTITPGGYLVVAKSLSAFQSVYTTSTADVVGGYSGQLSNGGELLLLYDNLSTLIDWVAYDDEGHWPEEADGDGPSLELIHPGLDNAVAHSWAAGVFLGTPGLPNSRFQANPPPFLVRPRHTPAVPQPSDPITISVYAYDDTGIASVNLLYKEDEASSPFQQVAMLDDGAHGDGAAGDGVYGAILPARPQGTILEFWMRGTDTTARITDVPTTAPVDNFLLQVDGQDFAATTPTYRVVMKADDHLWLHTRDIRSDELLNATFVYGDEVYYNVGVRFRGKGSRTNVLRYSYRVQFTEQEPFHDIENLNLNAQWIRTQFISMDLFRRIGLPAPATRMAFLVFKYHDKNTYHRYDGDPPWEEDLLTMGWRIQMQDVNRRFLRQWYPGHSGGNLYRGVWCSWLRQADFTYYGPDKEEYRCPYEKKTNEAEDDFSDVIELCDVFTNTPDALVTPVFQQYIDLPEWSRFWGGMAAVNVEETDIYNTRGDDYYLYFDPATSPPVIQAHLLPWDLDEANPNPNESIFVCSLPQVNRFARNPDFTPQYFAHIQDILDHHYRLDIQLPLIDALAPYSGYEIPAGGEDRDTLTLEELKEYARARMAYLESVISRELTVNVNGAAEIGGVYYAASPSVSLSGRGLTAYTRWVTVDGQDAHYQHLTGDWGPFPLALNPGPNTAVVECLTTAGVAITTETLSIRYVTTYTEVCGTLTADTVWTAAQSPYLVTCDVVVPNGVTLAIEPGTIVLLSPGCSIFTSGTLLAEGTAASPIFLTAASERGPQTLIPADSAWRYDDTGTDLGAAWRGVLYDDSGWSTGPPQLGYGDGDETTILSYGGDPFNKHPCYYFRRRFDLADPGGIDRLILRVIRDDGIVVYLNDSELWRDNLPAGPVTYDTWALTNIGRDGENAWVERAVGASALVAGTNVIAAEVHQLNPTNPDLGFALALETSPTATRWGVIALHGADHTCRLSHCVIAGGSADARGGQFYGGMVSVVNSPVEIEDCSFHEYAGSAVEAVSGTGTVFVRRCSFDLGGRDCIDATGHAVVVEDSVFAQRTEPGAAAISLRNETLLPSLIRQNQFHGATSDVVALENARATIEYNTIRLAGEAGIRLGSASRCALDHNVIHDCGRGVVVRNGAAATLDHNTLYGHTEGIVCQRDLRAPGDGGGTAAVINTILWQCATAVRLDAESTVTVSFCDVQGGWPGIGNFDLDPLFLDESGRDFHIRVESPCRDRGENGTYVGAFPAMMSGLEVRRWKLY